MPIDARRMATALANKLGFTVEQRRHQVFQLEYRGNTVTTLMSHGAQEIDDRLAARMALQLNLTMPQLREAVACPLSREDYLTILAEHFGLSTASIAEKLPDEDLTDIYQRLREAIREMLTAPGPDAARTYTALQEHARTIGYTDERIQALWSEVSAEIAAGER